MNFSFSGCTNLISNATDAPVAAGDAYSVGGDGFLKVTVTTGLLANDLDADGNALRVNSIVTITVNHINHPPLPNSDAYTIAGDSVLNVPVVTGVLANDLDLDGDTLFVLIQSLPNHGALHQDLDGGFTYQPTPGFQGLDSFTYQANDGNAVSNTVTVSISVNAVNHPNAEPMGCNIAEYVYACCGCTIPPYA